MVPGLSNIEEALERSVFHLLRKQLVKYEFLPDVFDYDTENQNDEIAETESKRFMSDLNIIRVEKGFAIEIFNFANNQYYGTKNPPRIVVETESFLQGQLGLDTVDQYDLDPITGQFKVKKSVSMVSDFYFNVHLVANTVQQMRVLHGIMNEALPRRGYVPWYDKEGLQPSFNLLIRYISMADYSFLPEGIIEKVYRYEIPDVHEIDDKLILKTVSPIKNIDVTIKDDKGKELDNLKITSNGITSGI